MANTVKLGFFGLKNRDLTLLAAAAMKNRGARVVACFDNGKNPEKIAKFRELFPKAAVCATFDSFVKSGVNAVILGDNARGTAEKAQKFLELGIPVLAGTMPAGSLEDTVKLVRAAEKTGAEYMTGCPEAFSATVLEMKQLYSDGSLGKLIYGEGEYLGDGKGFRKDVPALAYGTNALLPLLFITGETPDKLIARASFSHCDAEALGVDTKEAMPQTLVHMKSGAVLRLCASVRSLPHGAWLRLGTTKGGIESRRGAFDELYYGYSDGFKPAELKDQKNTQIRKAEYPKEIRRKYRGTDEKILPEILMLNYFVSVLHGEQQNFFNVYTAATLASVLLLACRSAYNDGTPYLIPDFSIESIRKMYERDSVTPFPCKNNVHGLPVSGKRAK